MKTNDVDLDFGYVKGAPLVWLRLESGFVFILSILLYSRTGTAWWHLVALLLTPDLAMAGYWLNARLGAALYNVAHSYTVPIGLIGIAVVTGQTTWTSSLLIWTAHLGMDRVLGYGLKYPVSFQSTHLGRLGKRSV